MQDEIKQIYLNKIFCEIYLKKIYWFVKYEYMCVEWIRMTTCSLYRRSMFQEFTLFCTTVVFAERIVNPSLILLRSTS